MLDWSALSHAYGSAEDIPALLAELESTQSETILDELWQRLDRQGAVYSASFAALPDLIRIAERYHPRDRLKILSLIMGILTGEDAENLRRPDALSLDPGTPVEWTTTSDRISPTSPTRAHYTAEIATLLHLTEESLAAQDWSEFDFLHLLCALLALNGDLSWIERLDFIRFGFTGICTNCDADIGIFIIEEPAFAECEGTDGEARQTLLKPANPSDTESAQWLNETARKYKQDTVAGWIAYWLGTGTCPQCKTSFKVSEMSE